MLYRLFEIRIESGRDSSSKDQTFCTTQNVLLQSLEDFEGILTAMEAETLAGKYELAGVDIDLHIRQLLRIRALRRKSGHIQILINK